MANITQREARRLRKRVEELERLESRRQCAWVNDYPGGVHLRTVAAHAEDYVVVVTARKLGHACIVLPDATNMLRIYALPMAK